MEVEALAELLHETAERHGVFEAVAPPHDWWDWYAAYMDARQAGSEPDDASAAAGRYMAEVKHVVVAPPTSGANHPLRRRTALAARPAWALARWKRHMGPGRRSGPCGR